MIKWVFGPLIVIIGIALMANYEVMKHRGRKMCAEHGYLESTYIPANRAGFGEKYVFRKKRNPDGSVDEKAKLVIALD